RQVATPLVAVTLVVPQVTHASSVRYHYIPIAETIQKLNDGAGTSNGIHSFLVRDGVLGLFELNPRMPGGFDWAFADSQVVDVLAAIRIGYTMDVRFRSEE